MFVRSPEGLVEARLGVPHPHNIPIGRYYPESAPGKGNRRYGLGTPTIPLSRPVPPVYHPPQ
jgi:hypothetical protein